MISDEVKRFVQAMRASGHSEGEITRRLRASGWAEDDIQSILADQELAQASPMQSDEARAVLGELAAEAVSDDYAGADTEQPRSSTGQVLGYMLAMIGAVLLVVGVGVIAWLVRAYSTGSSANAPDVGAGMLFALIGLGAGAVGLVLLIVGLVIAKSRPRRRRRS